MYKRIVLRNSSRVMNMIRLYCCTDEITFFSFVKKVTPAHVFTDGISNSLEPTWCVYNYFCLQYFFIYYVALKEYETFISYIMIYLVHITMCISVPLDAIIIHNQWSPDYILYSFHFLILCVSVMHAINHVFTSPCWEFIRIRLYWNKWVADCHFQMKKSETPNDILFNYHKVGLTSN